MPYHRKHLLDQLVGLIMVKESQTEVTTARERILDTALEVMAKRGYTAAGVKEIVDLSGTSKGSFYFHFPSKERMVIALLERMSDKLIDKVNNATKNQPTPLHRLSASIDSLMAIFARKRNIAQVLLLNVVGNGKATDIKFLPVRERFLNLIKQELDAAVQAGQIAPVDTALASRIWLGGIYEVILHWLLTGQPASLAEVTPALRKALLMSVGADLSTIETQKI